MKAFFAVALVTLFAAVSCQHVGDEKTITTEIIKQLIEKNRDKLANISVEIIGLGEHGGVYNLFVQNVETLVLEKCEAPGPLSLDIKNLTISLQYANASALFNFIAVNIPEVSDIIINGNGTLEGEASGIVVTVALNFKLKGLGVELLDFTGFDFFFDKITAQLSGIEDEDEVNSDLNANLANFLNIFIKQTVNDNKEAIIAAINEILSEIV